MNDLISRQAAIDAADKIIKRDTSGNNDVVKAMTAWKCYIQKLPFSQPEIIRCKDCKWFNDSGCAIRIVYDSGRPKENDFCSFAERRTDETD